MRNALVSSDDKARKFYRESLMVLAGYSSYNQRPTPHEPI
jgi:hypothetical protein